MAGESAGREAQRLERAARAAKRRAEAFARGEEGERAVAEALAPLLVDGWYHLGDRRAPKGGNIDHIVIGPTGVWVINAKNWSRPVTVGSTVRCGSRSYDAVLPRAVQEMRWVADALEDAGAPSAVRSVLCFVGTPVTVDAGAPEGVSAVGVEDLVHHLHTQPPALNVAAMERALRVISDRFPAATAAAPRPAPVDPAAADTTCPTEIGRMPLEKRYRIYLAQPWRKGAHDRIYLRSCRGEDLGWIDRRTGDSEMRGRSAEVPALLARCATDDVPDPDVPPLELGGAILRALRRAVNHVDVGVGYLVATRWQKSGKDRLYVKRHNAGLRPVDVGFIDVVTGDLHPHDRNHEGLLRHVHGTLFDQL